MFIKLGIIVVIVALGGIIFLNGIDTFFPATSTTVIDSFKVDASALSAKASESIGEIIDKSIEKTRDFSSDILSNHISKVGDTITSQINNVKESSQEIITKDISNFNLLK